VAGLWWLVPVALVAIGAVGLIAWSAGWSPGTSLVLCADLCTALYAGLEVFIVTTAGLTITWLALYFLGAAGLYCSARSHSSWRSLLGTVAIGYGGGAALFCVSTPLSCASSVVLWLLTELAQELLQAASSTGRSPFTWSEALLPAFWSVGTAIAFWWVARSLVQAAERHIATHDRIPTGRVRLIDLDLPIRPRRPVRRG
jgi:hypothetical protein